MMKKVLTIGGISLALLTILGIGVFAKGDNSDRLYYDHHHHEHNYQECMNDNINSHHHNHHQYYNCK